MRLLLPLFLLTGTLAWAANPTLSSNPTLKNFDPRQFEVDPGSPATNVVKSWSRQVNVLGYGAKADGLTDDAASIQVAINAAGPGSSAHMPRGTYYVRSTIYLTNQIQELIGDGARATYIYFDPAVASSCIVIRSTTASKQFQTKLVGIGFQSANNAIAKTAIELDDVSLGYIADIEIAPWYGTGSKGIWWRGRDATVFERLMIAAERPLVIDTNSTGNSIAIDQTVFRDCAFDTMTASGKAIEIMPKVNLTETSFTGYQIWELGKYGLYWKDTNNTQVSFGLHISGMRREQSQDDTGYSIYIERGSSLRDTPLGGNVLHNFTVRNSTLDSYQNGAFLRGVVGAKFDTVAILQSAYENLNADDTCTQIKLDNCWIQQSGVAVLTGLTNVEASATTIGATTLPETGLFLRGAGGNQPTTFAHTHIRGGLDADAIDHGTPWSVAVNATTNMIFRSTGTTLESDTFLGVFLPKIYLWPDASGPYIGNSGLLGWHLRGNSGTNVMDGADTLIIAGSALGTMFRSSPGPASQTNVLFQSSNTNNVAAVLNDGSIKSAATLSLSGQANVIGDNGTAITYNGVPITAGGGGGNMTNVGAAVVGMVPVATDTSGTKWTPTNSLTLSGTISAGGTGASIFTNGLQLLTATASTVATIGADQTVTNVPNAAGYLKNDGSGGLSYDSTAWCYIAQLGHASDNPAQNTTRYFGNSFSDGPSTPEGRYGFVVPKAGHITDVIWRYWVGSTLGTASQNITNSISINEGASSIVLGGGAGFDMSLASTNYVYTGLSQAVSVGDRVVAKIIFPATWTQAAQQVRQQVTILIGP